MYNRIVAGVFLVFGLIGVVHGIFASAEPQTFAKLPQPIGDIASGLLVVVSFATILMSAVVLAIGSVFPARTEQPAASLSAPTAPAPAIEVEVKPAAVRSPRRTSPSPRSTGARSCAGCGDGSKRVDRPSAQ